MGTVRLEGITKRFGGVTALTDLSFDVADGEFFTIVGPTKAGKTTTLRTIAGLARPDAGDIFINGQRVTFAHPSRRQVSLLFQNLALFPHYTGFENIAFPLRVAKCPDAEVRQRVAEVTRMLGVSHLLGRLPRTFSGGEQQRVALGRAIILPSEATLLDEPLSNLDARIRLALRNELKRLHRELRRTFLYVTHDQVEAMTLSDRVLVLHEGTIQQIGRPDEIYNAPRNRFVAELIGSPPMNMLPGRLESDNGRPRFVMGPIRQDLCLMADDLHRAVTSSDVALCIRPEDVEVSAEPLDAGFRAEVVALEPLGPKIVVELECENVRMHAIADPDWTSPIGTHVWVRFRARLHVLDAGTGLFIT
jgi:multiple sugar transport system ATP-binding protein